ncbi:hypothetical protein KVR01_001184 [Diaporthe batatas]|uniref:uncharacterized protein n=1 Tax=Diaporthe batatas TaxID=748121 RepID=UPI001D05ACA4|nr:uncharacterized protein KVR01_001184 [Diaporthe batatas]KAG8168435.1 hypothetical protein KVR01_001184 [Diaporthe batatas]
MSSKLGISSSKADESSRVKQNAPVEVANTTAVYEKYGNQYDELDMDRMGKLQEAPTTGGQYHWVSEMAPKQHQKFLSYLVVALATTQQLQGLIKLNMPSYMAQGWHGTLFSIAMTLFAIILNTVFVNQLPVIEIIGLVLHISAFVAFVVVLWAMGPYSDPKTVWTRFEDNSGWGNTGLSTLVGILGPIVTLIGSDSSCHLAEELRDAAWVLPRSMVATALVNYALGFVMTVTVMSKLGDDVSAVLSTSLGQPWIQVLYNATGSKAGTSVLAAVVWILTLFCCVNQVTTTSRQLFAFARDRGLPFSPFLAYVRPGWDVPVNAVLVTLLCTILLSLIIIGSTIAFNVITSLGQIGLVSSYIIVIACVFAKRIKGEPLLPSRFSLGKFGFLVNGLALSFLGMAFVFLFFPAAPDPTPAGMNWSCLLFGVILGFSLIYYWIWGRHVYVGPVEYIKHR